MRIEDALAVALSALRRDGLPGIRNLALAYKNLRAEPATMSSSPVMAQIEPTLHCNLACLMCANPLSSRQRRHLSLDEFKSIVDGMSFLKKLSLVGAGEPLMNTALFDMIAYAKSKGILTGFATNGMLLNDAMCEKILKSGADWINISIDSADKERFESIRKGARLNTVTANIHRLVEIKGSRKRPEISVWFVIMKDNMDDLPGVIRLAASLGVKKVSAQLEHNWSNEKLRGGMLESHSKDFYASVGRLLKRSRDAARSEGVKFDYVNVPDPASGRACKWPWKSCYITAEGFVTPCCLQGSDPEVINFGNLLESDFAGIWNSAGYRHFRDSLKTATPPGICADCTAYFGKAKI